MTSATMERTASSMPDDDHYARNLIGGSWRFPAAPYEFEIRNPSDSTISTVVPLSSRFDVDQAFQAARDALHGTWAAPTVRAQLLHALVDRIDENRMELARLQCMETGLSVADSLTALSATARVARSLLRCGAAGRPARARGVSGHILSWGLPFFEVVTSVIPALARGDSVIVKPSLRGPLTPVAFALLATDIGLPAGVINIVHGTGVDIGADLISRRDLSALHVRAGERTIAQALRARQRTGVPLHALRAGGNVTIVGPGGEADGAALVDSVTAGVRVHSGPFGLPLLAVHRDAAEPILAVLVERLRHTVAAPLPTEPLRTRALDRIRLLVSAGAEVLLGGRVPDDIPHRMAWRIPPTVLNLGPADSPAVRAEQASVPLGPVLGVITWDRWSELQPAFTAARALHGTASMWGTYEMDRVSLPHGLIVARSDSQIALSGATLPAAWTGGAI